ADAVDEHLVQENRPRFEYSSGLIGETPPSAARRPRSPGRAVSAEYVRSLNKRMHGLWLHDIESLEAISQNDDTRRIFLRMAALQQAGRLPNFLAEIASDDDL